MANLDQLMAAGLISGGTALSQEDQDIINSLTPDEVSALISIKSKLTPGFIQRNLGGGATGTRGQASMGIVF